MAKNHNSNNTKVGRDYEESIIYAHGILLPSSLPKENHGKIILEMRDEYHIPELSGKGENGKFTLDIFSRYEDGYEEAGEGKGGDMSGNRPGAKRTDNGLKAFSVFYFLRKKRPHIHRVLYTPNYPNPGSSMDVWISMGVEDGLFEHRVVPYRSLPDTAPTSINKYFKYKNAKG